MRHATTQSRFYALLEVAEEELLRLDSDKNGQISLDEIAVMIKRLFLRLELPWFAKLIFNERLIVFALEKALQFGPVVKREQEDIVTLQSRNLVRTEQLAYVDVEDREVLDVRPAAVDNPEELLVAPVDRLAEQRDRQEELLQKLLKLKAAG